MNEHTMNESKRPQAARERDDAPVVDEKVDKNLVLFKEYYLNKLKKRWQNVSGTRTLFAEVYHMLEIVT